MALLSGSLSGRETETQQADKMMPVSGTENDRGWGTGQGVLPELNLKDGKALALVRAVEEQA